MADKTTQPDWPSGTIVLLFVCLMLFVSGKLV